MYGIMYEELHKCVYYYIDSFNCLIFFSFELNSSIYFQYFLLERSYNFLVYFHESITNNYCNRASCGNTVFAKYNIDNQGIVP